MPAEEPASSSSPLHATRPNIVLVLVDDMGACDLGAYGNPDAQTPRLDALARQSLRHEAFYVTPVCAPTRAALITGRHHLRTGVTSVHGGKDHVDLSERTIAQVLKSAGYATGLWGKWHSGMSDGYLPHQRGFDETLLPRLYKHRDPIGSANGGEETPFPGQWGDDVIVDHALDFARRHRAEPFFAFVNSMTPHAPLDAPEEEIRRLMTERGMSRNLATLHAQMARLDSALGRLLDGLEQLDTGSRETVFLFLSDNGPAMFEDHFTDADRDRRNTLNWRGWKGDVWENGIRTPLFIHWPGRIEPGEVSQVADATDLLPTFTAWAGADLEPDHKPLDGRDISPMLTGSELPPKPVYSWVHPAIPPAPGRGEARLLQDEYGPVTPEIKPTLRATDQVMALRDGPWKLTHNADLNRPGGPWPVEFLGHIPNDPLERHDQRQAHPGIVEDLRGKLERWWSEMLAEPASFQQPEILIRATGNANIRAVTTARVTPNLRNGVSTLSGFRAAGNTAAWRVRAETTRQLIPQLHWHPAENLPAPGTRFTLHCSGARTQGASDESGKIHWDSPLTIDAGPNTLELTLETEQPDNASLNLRALILKPQETGIA